MQKSLHWKKRCCLSLIQLFSMLWMTGAYAQFSGALNGVFSVGENTQVNFSQGNLQYVGSTSTPYWKFAEHQWDYFGSTQNGTSQNVDRDLFGFATSGYNHGSVCYHPWSTSTNYSDYYAYGSSGYNLYDKSGKADWGYNAIANGGNLEKQWRTLTKDEWVYLFDTRTTLSGIRYAQAVVNNVNGVILFPDNWNASVYELDNFNNSYFGDNIITLSDWTNTLEPSGAVFLPASGYRDGSSTDNVNYYGCYWSSSVYEYDSETYIMSFGGGSLYPQNTANRYYGFSVRLVKNCPMTMGIINAVPNPSEGGSVTGQGLFNVGETCTLTASANSKFAFVNWTKNGVEVSTNPTYSFTVTGNASYMANFTRTDINEISIGLGASNYSDNIPLNRYYSLVQQIYTADEIGVEGPIDEIAFYMMGTSRADTAAVDVYLKHTSKASFEDDFDWETLDLGDLYFSGSYTFGGSTGWKTIKLDTPFNYNGEDNLLVCIDNNAGNYYDYHDWYTYPTDDSRALASWDWDNSNPFNPPDGSRYNYNNQIRLGFLITQQTSLSATPDPINLGYRPNGAWMPPFKVNIFNSGCGTTINNISTNNSYFQADNDLGLPFYLGYNEGFELGLNSGTGEGEINASMVISYGSQNHQAHFDVTATAYTPSLGDVWETAEELTDFPFAATLTPAYIPLFGNYRLPPTNIPDGPDAVYKLVFTEDTYLNASVPYGENGKVALYPEGFDNVGGPDLDNCYYGPTVSRHEWLTYDNGTTYTNVSHNSGTTTWGYKFPAANLASYAGAKMTQVALYSNSNTGGITTVMIYKGGDNAPETLVSTQSFNLPSSLYAYYNVTLETPLRITGRENVWVVFSAKNNGHYPAVTTNNYYDNQYNGCWWYDYDSDAWMRYQYRGNWKIKAYVTTDNNRQMIVRGEDEGTGHRNIVTIGDGSTTNNQYLPSYSYYNYSLTQQLYTAAEIGQAGNISSIAFYNGGTEKTRSYTIYMVNTNKSVFSSSYDWIPVTFDDQVFNGSVTMLEDDWTTIPLNMPFEYDGYSNLALVVKDNTGYDSYGLTCRVFTPAAYSYCSLYTYGSSNFDPYNPTDYYGSRARSKNQIQLNITPIFDNEIVNMTVVPGTYYLVASSTSDSWSVNINAETMPCPKVASNPTPSNNSTTVSPTFTQLKWDFGKRTTEYMLKFGTTSECENTLVEWTRDLCNTYTLMGLNNNTQYYWKVLERNDGCPEGTESPTWSFTTRLDGPYIYTSTSYMYVGDTLQLSWSALADTSVYAYNIYQDDSLIGSCSTNYYDVIGLNYNPSVGYTFKVSAIYIGGESSFYNTENVRVSGRGSVSGHVYEQDGVTPIPNANVIFNGRDEFNISRTLTFITDSTGYYNGNVYVGSYSGQSVCPWYQNKVYSGTIAIVYNTLVSGIDFVMDEYFEPVGNVVANYYPDAFNISSPYVKVLWNQKPNYVEDFESQNFSSFDWTLDPTCPWQISNDNSYEGNYCMKSGVPSRYNSSTMQVSVYVPCDCNISFFCEFDNTSWGNDEGFFYVDNNQVCSWGSTEGWTEFSYPVSVGTHTFKWSFYKGYGEEGISGSFYVDNINFCNTEGTRESLIDNSNRSFQHYRVYRTDYYNNGPFSEDNTLLLSEVFSDTLYIDATWADADMGVYKYGVSKVYEGNRGHGIYEGDSKDRSGQNVTFGFEDGHIPTDWNNDISYPWIISTNNAYNSGYCMASGNYNVHNSSSTIEATIEFLENGSIDFYSRISSESVSYDYGVFFIDDEEQFREGGSVSWSKHSYSVTPGIHTFRWYYRKDGSENSGDDRWFVDDISFTGVGVLVNVQGERESRIMWSNAIDKNMYLANGVDITVSLNSGDSPEGVSVTFTNLSAAEQQAYPTDNNIVLDASGYYAWGNFRKGDYQVMVAIEGYETVVDTLSIWDNTTMNYLLNEILYSPNDLYVSRTGWALWHDHNNSLISELAGDCFEYNFDNGNVDGLTFINADSYYSNWMLASHKFGTGYGHNGSMDCLVSQSYDFDEYNNLYPNEYVVFPLVRFGNNSTLSFYACRHYADSYSEQFAVAVSTSSNSNPANFTIVREWTMNSNQSNWVHFTVNLGEYAGQTGYIAIRHYNNGNSSRNTLDIDDVVLSNGNRGGKGNRHFENYQVILMNTDEQFIYSGNTSDCFVQLPTENLMDGETYHCKVAAVYNTGTSEWVETDWVYQSCDHFESVSELNFEMNAENNVLTWSYPEVESTASNTSTAFACNYDSYYYDTPIGWISYSIDNPKAISLLNGNISVYGGDYCGVDGYVHATSNSGYNSNWYKIDPFTGVIVEQGPMDMYFSDCAWDYSTNTMFGICNNNRNLYLWDIETNTTAIIGYMDDRIRVLACDLEGQLWGISYSGSLYKIEKTTASITYVGNTRVYPYDRIQSAGFDHNTGKLYWAHYNGYLYEVDTETCQITEVASQNGCQSSWCIPYTGELSSPSGILGVAIYRDNEFAGFTYGNSFIDTVATGNHEYSVRAVYNGTAHVPYRNSYFSMSCPSIVGGEVYSVTTTASPTTGGNVTGSSTYINGLSCTLTATANPGYVFANWTENGEVVSSCPEYTFVVRDNHAIVGNFIEYNPHWSVVNNSTYSDMSIIGVLQFNGIEQTADYYEVGVFCNGECRGKQVLTYNHQLQRSILTMTVRGRNNDKLTFKVYDHLQGGEIDLICMNELTFAMNTVVGSFNSPYPINLGIRQSTIMEEGWNWYSTYIEQEDIDGLRMLENSLGSEGVMIKSQDDGFVINYQSIWSGSLNGIHNEQMYMINAAGPTKAYIVGNKVNGANHPIKLYPGWTWIGNPYETPISFQDALADFTPTNGDIMKTQQSFSSYLDGLGWFGSFNTLEPGMGFMYYSNKNTASTLNYAESSNRNERIPNVTADNNYWIPNAFEYPYNMTMMAVVMLDDKEITNDQYELAAFANGKCIGSSRLMYNGGMNRYLAYLTIYGEESVDIQFGLYDMASGTEYYSANETLSFEINSILGNMTEPFVVHFDGTTGLNPSLETAVFLYPNPVLKGDNCKIGMLANGMEKATIEIIDALGSVISVETAHQQPINITAPNTAGVYTVRIMVEGQGSYCRKLIVK